MMDDVLTTIKAQLHERATSPLLGSFIFSWCIVNYKFLMIVISGITVTEKISYIDLFIFPTYKQVLLNGVLFPALAALAIIFVYPYPAKHIFRHARKNHKYLKEIQQGIDDDTPLTLEESKQIRRTAISDGIELTTEIERRKKDNADLKDTINNYMQIVANHNAELGEYKRKTDELEESTKIAKSALAKEEQKIIELRDALTEITQHPAVTKYGEMIFSNSLAQEARDPSKNSPLMNSFNRIMQSTNLTAKTEIEKYAKEKNIFKERDFQVMVADGRIIILTDDGATEWGKFTHENLSVDIDSIKQKLDIYARNN